ncbi:CaiB/BaiF CoA-transferase family protein [Streptomyces sp. SCSIO 75703]|uniref:CaiB/BaiF CoA transferase family protein n=1 Tax=unclassified Streptomyces TaxID=2593676 RepID=UPI00099D07F6|nr:MULTISPECIES: CaiB/BaiF CoA-transferase family protein [unclassified Streptomyces]
MSSEDTTPHRSRVPADTLPLAGVRVVELGNFIAAPTAGRLLADFGAEVIKVERPRTGDELRNWRLFAGDTSMLYRTINRNKKSVELDLRTDDGRASVLELVSCSDVLIENFRPGTLDRWGLTPQALTAANPELVVARISAFGQTGPLAARPGFAAVAEAFGGMRELVGDPDRPPSRVGVSIGDSIAGLYAAFGVVMSLLDRGNRKNQGRRPWTPVERHVDVALHEAVFSMMESLVPDYSAHGVLRERTGGRMQGIAPSNAYVCAGGDSVVIAGNGDSIFARYMETIGRPDLRDDPGLATNDGRWARRDELDRAIEEWTSRRPREEVLTALAAAGVPAGPIHTAKDIVDDEQFAARDMVQALPVDIAGETRDVLFPGIVPVLDHQSVPVSHPGPDLGEHTHEVLSELLARPCGCRACLDAMAELGDDVVHDAARNDTAARRARSTRT